MNQSEQIAELLDKWADVLDIPSGDFVKQDLRAAAEHIRSLHSTLIIARDAIASVHEATFGEGNMGGLSDPYPIQAEILHAITTAIGEQP